ncbi:MAG TPA: hypothetical protein VGL63_03780 [Streptosporangiaceae bacterium]
MRGLSRREFFGGAAGLGAVAALSSSTITRAAVTSRASRAIAARGARTARSAQDVGPLAGAIVNLGSYPGSGTYLNTANIFDGFVGLPLATTFQKVYMGHGSFPSTPSTKVTQLAAAGCQFLISIEPNRDMTTNEQKRIRAWLAMLNNAGISYRVSLYSECNNKAFATADEWLTYWNYYAPVVQDAGVVCAYEPGCGFPALPRAVAYFPTSPVPSELWLDYYATAFRAGGRIDQLISMAQTAGISTGIGEWGWSAGPSVFTPMVMPWWNEYCAYLISLAQQGKLAYGGMYFGSVSNGREADVIGSASDPRVPGIQNVSNALAAG